MNPYILLAQTGTTATESLSLSVLLLKTLLATGIILVIAFLVIKYLIPKISHMGRNKESDIRILDMQVLEGRKSIYVVEIQGKTVALGVTEQQIQKICDLD